MNAITFSLPEWVDAWLARRPECATDTDRMRLAIDLARENVLRGAGGPFGAAVFRHDHPAPVAVGVNSVQRLNNSVLHAEVLALMLAEAQLGAFSLRQPPHTLFTSCEPCAMCLGAILWCGVARVVCGADRAAATRLGFDEGPVFPESYVHLAARGITVERGLLAEEAVAVLELYRQRLGIIYNG